MSFKCDLKSNNHRLRAFFSLLLLLLLSSSSKNVTEKSITNILSTVWMKWYIIFIIYDIVELFNMHKSFSFYLNIKFFAHKILNARFVSFKWNFGYTMLVGCYHVGPSGWFTVITSFSVDEWMNDRAIKGVRSCASMHISAKLHTLLLLSYKQAVEWWDFDTILLLTVLPSKFISSLWVCALHHSLLVIWLMFLNVFAFNDTISSWFWL